MKKKIMAVVATALSAILLFGVTACGRNHRVAYAEITLTVESYGYCVAPDDADLLNSVNELLAEIKADGTLDALYAAEEDGTAGNIGAVRTASENRSEELVVATNAAFAPFEYKQGDNFAGIDMQIAKLLAEKLNKTLVIVDMDFDSVILSVSNGQCDIGMAGLTISNGRADNVTFSDAYYSTAQYIAYVEGNEIFTACQTAEDVENAIKGLTNATAGAATGQTGEAYLKGSQDFDFEGFPNVDVRSYDTIAQAVQDLSNGRLDFVVGDKDTLKAAVSGING